MPIVYLNGKYLPQEQATISIMDRGFLFGDGVYEVIPAYDNQLLGFNQHIDRLNNSLQNIHMQPVLTNSEWQDICMSLLEKNEKTTGNQNIYLQVTRGAQPDRSHAIPATYTPTIVAFCTKTRSKPLQALEHGFSAITIEDTRRSENFIKAIGLLPNILLYEKARRAGAIEAILKRNHKILECTSSNLFMVKDGVLMTPPLNEHILSGVTRRIILDIAATHHIPVKECEIDDEMLNDADEIWVSGSGKEICPIIELDGHAVGTGTVGPIWKKIYALYKAATKIP